MKKVFFRVLPLAAAVLFATSCSKDENSENNEPVNVVKQEKTVTVTGTLSKKSDISKLSCANGVDLTFDGNETLVFSGDGGKIHGETTLHTEAGATVDFTVELSYPADASYDLDGKTVTATIGTAPTGVTGSYENINAAAKDVYEVSEPVTISASGNDFNFSDNIVMNVNVAFVKNEKSAAISVSVNDGAAVSLASGKICIVPADVKVTADGKTKNTTVAGQIYTIEAALTLDWGTSKTIVWGNNTQTVTATIIPAQTITWSHEGGNENNEYTSDGNTFSVFVKGTGNFTITATAADGTTATCTITVPTDYVDLGTGVYWKTSDENGTYKFGEPTDIPSPWNVPSEAEFNLLSTSQNVTYSNATFTNNNGSGASITLRSFETYWSRTEFDEERGRSITFYSSFQDWNNSLRSDMFYVRLVRTL
ncbi:MAG: hypothetical protein IKO99_02215 [Bacteroidales bacterium]|nr:hypothetical protein [Bacteroidales bacterium]